MLTGTLKQALAYKCPRLAPTRTAFHSERLAFVCLPMTSAFWYAASGNEALTLCDARTLCLSAGPAVFPPLLAENLGAQVSSLAALRGLWES